MSRMSVGKALFVSGELVAAWESGRSLPQPNHLISLIGILEFGPDIVVRILEDLVSGEVSPQWTGKWQAIEVKADMLLSFEHSIFPGLLQTEDYARIVLKYNDYSPIDPETLVQERLSRQQEVFGRENPPTTIFLLDEQILRRPANCEPAIMYEQLAHVLEMAKRPRVIVQVVPVDDTGYHPGLAGAFMLAKLDGKEVAFQDGTITGYVLEDNAQVSELSSIWYTVHAAAIPRPASIDLIAKAAEEWKARSGGSRPAAAPTDRTASKSQSPFGASAQETPEPRANKADP